VPIWLSNKRCAKTELGQRVRERAYVPRSSGGRLGCKREAGRLTPHAPNLAKCDQ